MSNIELVKDSALGPVQGIVTEIALGLVLLALVYYVKTNLVRSTKDFVIANRKIGFGFGVAGLISIWTWAMAVMMSAAMTYQFGLSGLFWFTVPNGLAVIAVIPFARRIRERMPNGYTISEFVGARFGGYKLAALVVTVGMLFGSLIEVIINIKGTALVVSSVFGVEPATAALVGLGVVLLYSILGGLWASMSTSTLTTLFITVPSAVVIVAALHRAGGAASVWNAVAADPRLLSVARADAAGSFGITLALGLLTATIAGQEFWQVAWSLKKKDVSRTFLWAGAWFYPIPICLGILGLIGIALKIDLKAQLGGDPAAIGPYLVSHLGLPVWLVIAYVFVILSACYSTIDGAFTAISSIFVVDIIKKAAPGIRERSLLVWAKIPMVIAAAVAAAVVVSGADFVTIVLTTYAIRTAILVPLMLAIFWPRMTGAGFVWGTVAGIVIGMPLRAVYGELAGSAAILSISALVPLVLGYASKERFDFERLKTLQDAAVASDSEYPEARDVAAATSV